MLALLSSLVNVGLKHVHKVAMAFQILHPILLSGCQMKRDLKVWSFKPFKKKYLLLLVNSWRLSVIPTVEHCSSLSNTDYPQQRFGPKVTQKLVKLWFFYLTEDTNFAALLMQYRSHAGVILRQQRHSKFHVISSTCDDCVPWSELEQMLYFLRSFLALFWKQFLSQKRNCRPMLPKVWPLDWERNYSTVWDEIHR